MDVSVSIDVPSLAEGFRFYSEAFGLEKLATPYPGVMVLKGASATITLLERHEHSKPSPHTTDERHFSRHWTPVHLDFHVQDFKGALVRALKAGATQEQVFEHPQHGSAAFCADPFGNGFCLLQQRPVPAT
ncbi:MAG: VOC family protein [Alphaproteobacteria bacterium]|nr:VOC family protein [Alphaproteobacteria bacterium]